MPYFPLFVDLSGKDCLVVGGGRVATRKARALLEFGAAVRALDPRPSLSMRTVGCTLLARPYRNTADMAGAALVIAATDRPELNALVARHARSAGIPVNVADDPGGSTFFFPAVVRRGEFVTGISTAGLCPRFAARFREGLDAVLPEELGVWVEALGQERRCVSGVERIGRLDSIIDPLLRQIFVM